MGAPVKRRTARAFKRDITEVQRLRLSLSLTHALAGDDVEDAREAIELIDKLTATLTRMHLRAMREERGQSGRFQAAPATPDTSSEE